MIIREIRKGIRAKTEALVLMHVDSVDSYAFHFSEFDRQVGRTAGSNMVSSWLEEVEKFVEDEKPVIIVDQYDDHHSFADQFFSSLPESSYIHRIRFDEDQEEWSQFRNDIQEKLEELNVKEVYLGGIWYEPRDQTGCAYEAEQIIKGSGVKVTPLRDLLGSENDYDVYDESASVVKDDPAWELIYQYKHNPNVGDHTQVEKIVRVLHDDHPITIASRKALGKKVIQIYRGGENVSSESNAGWTTDPQIAAGFACQHYEGEICLGEIGIDDVLYFDQVNSGYKGAIVEDEVILKPGAKVKILKCITITDEDRESYSDNGYPSEEVVSKAEALAK